MLPGSIRRVEWNDARHGSRLVVDLPDLGHDVVDVAFTALDAIEHRDGALGDWICNTYLDNFYRDIPASLNSTGLI